ncbi:hypothetical protein Cob_v001421 [Colletotrichum orbiculare MAFF 240422]|uniref:Uncharacterized protein n=1 Tax=Colletotrichum orbiculare (strain 104-T / ATCC 96160 / CBS 514.97 / LARS 414 / MAFF 240422) TaxID=1213857 RepID=A0A484G5A0_COLOR|nr:hypothetical protein Cob_v001421 [Colletotrichum orbiculare MAFF 240422]
MGEFERQCWDGRSPPAGTCEVPSLPVPAQSIAHFHWKVPTWAAHCGRFPPLLITYIVLACCGGTHVGTYLPKAIPPTASTIHFLDSSIHPPSPDSFPPPVVHPATYPLVGTTLLPLPTR